VGAEHDQAHPRVVRVFPSHDAAKTKLIPGDRLLRAGTRELAGATAWAAYAALHEQADRRGVVELVADRAGVHIVSAEPLATDRYNWAEAALGLCFVATALLLLRRAPASPMVRGFALASLVWALAQVQFPDHAFVQTYAWFGLRGALAFLWPPLMLYAALLFPDGAWPDGRRLPLWPWLSATLGLTWLGYWSGSPLPTEIALRANPLIAGVTIAAILVVVTRNYARADAVGRRQVRWVLLGCYVALAISLGGTLVGVVDPELAPIWYLSRLALIAIPLSVYVAVVHSNLLDVDRLISSTAVYTLLLVAIGSAALTALPWLASHASARVGVDPTLAQVGLAAVVAWSAIRVEPIVRPHLERVFFRERRALQDEIGRLVAAIHAAPSPGAVADLVGDRLDQLLRPEFCVLYARSQDVLAPIYVRRCAITPHFELAGTLVRQLAQHAAAIDLDGDRGFAAQLDAGERAALRGLDAAALVPVVRAQGLQGFVALGRKTSGDVYTSTDLALLGLVASSTATALLRFDDEMLLDGARQLQERLRQYVPASIANRLAEGRGLEASERHVSVLFADLRGYTGLAEGHHAEEIFRIVSRYTETVTRVVSEHGGTVVEFNGDGMMAVFGAPDPLPDKERRALAAARRIVVEVSALRGPHSRGTGARLEVGVGLATGSAFVGAIRSVDRHIWSALGNTTNLAARLQGMTRDFGVPIVIDRETHAAAGAEAMDFEPREATQIRGLRARHDIYVLAA